ncbi:phosphate ABC transporter permease PstA [Conexibacter sp. W3-3-2]|uniref:Phosphate transport system permease protein PstA n=1 Tax=Paraconexibacter algicola TaxID=2133960 RepID=A0A2T4UN26_9ACTN|nr:MULTISPECIES: phosphate ABC transporter permease PstA [Solirubrobacterales]MTD44011.1 phosphate ABC transporter permease PstA [Conexibacter sp. W3-3-2]PTL60642.1 phosphate ABC transporter permease PtsA [Paraconexibacter algicola]
MSTVAETTIARKAVTRSSGGESTKGAIFLSLLCLTLTISVVFLVALIFSVAQDGVGRLDTGLITEYSSRFNIENAGLRAAILGTLWLMGLTALVIIPIGVATAIYLEEYADPTKRINRIIEINIQNLASVPSVVFGLLGLAIFVRGELFGANYSLPFGLATGRPTLLAGALTLSLLVLPVVIIVSREAIRAVPPSIREGALALGATKWQTIWKQVLPGSVSGIATGVILALSRAIGETAPLILVGAASFLLFDPAYDKTFTALPISILSFTGEARAGFLDLAAAAIIVLLVILILMNSVAIYLRNRYEQKW